MCRPDIWESTSGSATMEKILVNLARHGKTIYLSFFQPPQTLIKIRKKVNYNDYVLYKEYRIYQTEFLCQFSSSKRTWKNYTLIFVQYLWNIIERTSLSTWYTVTMRAAAAPAIAAIGTLLFLWLISWCWFNLSILLNEFSMKIA